MKITLAHDLAAVTRLAVVELAQVFIDADAEAGALLTELVATGEARLELTTTFDRQRQPTHRLLLVPTTGDGEPVEVAVAGCKPTEPTPQGVESAFWFFGRMSHWAVRH
jgi:hypothetical protein